MRLEIEGKAVELDDVDRPFGSVCIRDEAGFMKVGAETL